MLISYTLVSFASEYIKEEEKSLLEKGYRSIIDDYDRIKYVSKF